MNYKPIPIGVENFKDIIDKGYYYVDKTLFIKDILDNKSYVNLYTRPRRFGKTLNISMLQYFFEDARNEFDGSKKDNSYLFEELNIMKCGEKYTDHMGKYPVINLSLKSGKQPTFELAYECIIDEISKEYIRHIFITKSDMLIDSEKEQYMRIINKSATYAEFAKSLQFLSICLEKYYNKKAIILGGMV